MRDFFACHAEARRRGGAETRRFSGSRRERGERRGGFAGTSPFLRAGPLTIRTASESRRLRRQKISALAAFSARRTLAIGVRWARWPGEVEVPFSRGAG